MLGHVLEVTGAEEYHYIGHSMGTLNPLTHFKNLSGNSNQMEEI